jgi:hypothetical protein
MSTEWILAEIDAEIAKLTQVRALLANAGKVAVKLAGKKGIGTAKLRKKRVLSADARKRIADAQRRRWAKQRAKSKS